MLARDGLRARHAAVQQGAEGTRDPVETATISTSSCPRTSPSRRSTAAALPVTICSHSAGSPPATRVTSRTPCPESARCSGGASASRPATSTASRCGRWEVRATATSCSSGAISSAVAPHVRQGDHGVDRLRAGACVRDDRPRAAVEERRRRGQRAGPLAARHRVRPDVPLERSPADSATAASGSPLTLPTSVTTASGPAGERPRSPSEQRRAGPPPPRVAVRTRGGPRRRDARAEPRGGADVLLVDVGEPHLDAVPAQRQADGGAEQPRPHDEDRAREALTHRRGPTGPGEVAAQRGRAVQVDVGDVGAGQVGLDVGHHPDHPGHRAVDLQLARAQQRDLAEARGAGRRTPGTPPPGRTSR